MEEENIITGEELNITGRGTVLMCLNCTYKNGDTFIHRGVKYKIRGIETHSRFDAPDMRKVGLIVRKVPQFNIGDVIKVCDDIVTIVDDFEWNEEQNSYQYWFNDEDGERWTELECAIEPCDMGELRCITTTETLTAKEMLEKYEHKLSEEDVKRLNDSERKGREEFDDIDIHAGIENFEWTEEKKARISNYIKMETEISKAITVLRKELLEDQRPGSYYDTWKSNIAMAIHDQLDSYSDPTIVNRSVICNAAAERFLKQLMQ